MTDTNRKLAINADLVLSKLLEQACNLLSLRLSASLIGGRVLLRVRGYCGIQIAPFTNQTSSASDHFRNIAVYLNQINSFSDNGDSQMRATQPKSRMSSTKKRTPTTLILSSMTEIT
jgi:hypothetical protein